MDKIIIQALEFYAAIGVSAAEREVGQRLVANVEVRFDLSRAGQSDDLQDTISYAEIAETIQDVGTTTECKLLEHMAERMAAAVLAQFPVEEVRLLLLKKPPPTPLIMEQAGVEITRARRNPVEP